MIKITATATIKSISPVIEIPSKNGGNPFQKRELVLDDPWTDRNGQLRSNYMLVEFGGEHMNQLDGFAPGHRVTVVARVQGREWNDKIIHSFRGESVVFATAQGYPQQPQNDYGMITPQTAYGQPQQQPFGPGSFPQQPGYNAPFPT